MELRHDRLISCDMVASSQVKIKISYGRGVSVEKSHIKFVSMSKGASKTFEDSMLIIDPLLALNGADLGYYNRRLMRKSAIVQ